MTESELREIDERIWNTARSVIEAGDTHRPMMFGLPNGPIVDVGSLMIGEHAKHAASILMAKLSQEYDVVCFITEAWVVEVAHSTKPADVSPSTHPDRKEVLMVVYVAKGLGNCLTRHDIRRDGNTVKLERGTLLLNVAGQGRFVPPARGMPQH